MYEKALIHKLVFTGHLTVSERKALPGRAAKASLILTAIEEALESGQFFHAWWLPDDSMVGCTIEYRGDGAGRVIWKYNGIEGKRNWAKQYASFHEASVDLVSNDWRFFDGAIDGVPIDRDA